MVFIKELESLRGLMALWVVLTHWGLSIAVPIAPLAQNMHGDIAVNVFFILSGFVICMLRDNCRENYGIFLLRRAFRLFPVYLVVLIVAALLLDYLQSVLLQAPQTAMRDVRIELYQHAQAHFWPHFVAHLTMLHGLIPASVLPNALYTFISPGWSITIEWQFYLIAPLLIATILGLPRPFDLAALALLVIIPETMKASGLSGFVGYYVQYFSVGIASYLLWREVTQKGRFKSLRHLRLVMAGALVACAFVFTPVASAAIWLAILYLILASLNDRARVERRLCSILQAAPLRYLGRISYSIYLSHILVLVLCLDVLNRLPLDKVSYAALLLVTLLSGTVAVSALLYRFVERPGIEAGRRLAASLVRGNAGEKAAASAG
jgi:peptidoglycan/LPS O-acetylase OafA/YrhL